VQHTPHRLLPLRQFFKGLLTLFFFFTRDLIAALIERFQRLAHGFGSRDFRALLIRLILAAALIGLEYLDIANKESGALQQLAEIRNFLSGKEFIDMRFAQGSVSKIRTEDRA